MTNLLLKRNIITYISKRIISVLILYMLLTGCVKVQEYDTQIALSVSDNLLSFESIDEQKTFDVISNDDWTVRSDATWLTISPLHGTNDGIITVKADSNTMVSPRETQLTVISNVQGVQKQTVRIVQSGNLSGIKMVYINAGTFIMGSLESEPDSNDNERPTHSVTLNAFRLSEKEITNDEYCRFLNANYIDRYGQGAVSGFSGARDLIYTHEWGIIYTNGQWRPQTGFANHPVVNVTWYGAKAFCDWAGGRLPTEAEWEYACRAGTTTPFNTGNNITTSLANFDGRDIYNGNPAGGVYIEQTQPVGSYAPNAWGLYDMHGNVREWCRDYWSSSYYSSSAVANPQGSTSSIWRMWRGGSWNDGAKNCRSAYRSSALPENYNNQLGFRLAADIMQVGADPDLTVSPESLYLVASAESKLLEVSSNSSWTASNNDFTWCTISSVSGSGNHQINVSVESNLSSSSRTAIITVTAGNVSKHIYIEQSGHTNNVQGIKMVSIHSGTFLIGSPPTESDSLSDERPRWNITISAFLLSENEITNEEYCRSACRISGKPDIYSSSLGFRLAVDDL